MNTGLLNEEMIPHSHRLGLLQIRYRSGKIIRHPLHCGEPDPSRATFPIISGRVQRRLIGAARLQHGAKVVQDFTLEAHQRKAVSPIGSERDTALDKPQRRFLPIFPRLRASRGQVSSGSLGILGPIEMFGAQYRISVGIPFRCALVQLSPPAPEQSVIDCVPDQRVRE